MEDQSQRLRHAEAGPRASGTSGPEVFSVFPRVEMKYVLLEVFFNIQGEPLV